MKQSNNNKKSRDVTAFLYERLSRDDNMDGESYSIGNQKKLLTKVAKEKGYTNLVHFFDDGISGVTTVSYTHLTLRRTSKTCSAFGRRRLTAWAQPSLCPASWFTM